MTTASIRSRPDTASGGFSLVELLVALTVCALLSGAIAAISPQARAAFDATPEALDLQQRERTVVDVLARAVQSAALLAATRDDGTAGDTVPAVELLDPDEEGEVFHALRVLSMAGRGRGVLEADQAGPSGALRLRADATCPSLDEVCGFSKGTIAAVVDVHGGFDVLTVGSASVGLHSIAPGQPLGGAYAAGSAVFEIAADTYYLDEQPDGSLSLVRETAAGAVQPIVDHLLELRIEPWRRAAVLARLDIAVRLGAESTARHRRVPERSRRLSVSLRNPS